MGSQVKQAAFRVCFQEVRVHKMERASPEGGHPLCGQSWSPHPPPGGWGSTILKLIEVLLETILIHTSVCYNQMGGECSVCEV